MPNNDQVKDQAVSSAELSEQISEAVSDHTYVPDSSNDYLSVHNNLPIKTIGNPNSFFETIQTHIIYLPELCPKSKNPKSTSYLEVSYVAKERFLEVFSLEKYIAGFIGHMLVRDVEYFAQEVGKEIALALGVSVKVNGHFDFNRLSQSLRTQIMINQSSLLSQLEKAVQEDSSSVAVKQQLAWLNKFN